MRYLTSVEIAAFLGRHPFVAQRVAATKALLLAGLLEDVNEPGAWDNMAAYYGFDPVIGYVPTQGEAVQDQVWGTVLIDPAPNGTIYFNVDDAGTGRMPNPGTINQPTYEPPPDPNQPTLYDYAWIVGVVVVGLAALAFLPRSR